MSFASLLLSIKNKIFHIDPRSQLEVAIDDGLTVGKHFQMKDGCILDPGHVFLITIGDNVTLAPRVHILAHDASTKEFTGYTKIGPVTIGDNVFIGANSTVLMGVHIGNNVIVGANSLVSKDIPDGCVCVGNPARVICTTEEYIEKNKHFQKERPCFDESYIITNITAEKKAEMKKKLDEEGFGYLV